MEADARILAGLPGKTPEESRAYYERAESAPLYEIAGYYGVTIGPEKDGPYVLYAVGDDNEKVALRLSIKEGDLVRLAKALADLVEARIAIKR